MEVYAKILLTKILTPFPTSFTDLQSPAALGIGAVVYNYDGDVYASDESRMLAEMRDTTFRLGSVHTDSYDQLFRNSQLRSLTAASVNEALPGCSDCAYQTYCGGDPVFHHATQGDPIGHRPTSEFCTKNMAIISELMRYIASSDRHALGTFWRWVYDRPLTSAPACPVP
jgi:radical SAM protein with 4Fe4S-binding SPASM domain